MPLDQIILRIGQTPVTLLDVLVVAAFLLLIAAVVFCWRAQALRRGELRRASGLEFRLAEMSGHLRGFAEQSQGSQAHLARAIDERLDQVNHRLGVGLHDQAERTGQSLTQLYERLAVIDAAQKNLSALSSEMVSLKDILANKQARGAYGQGRMEAIVRDGLHGGAYA
ncbi:MAG: DNA recombination protein RmuC, partial [Methylocella sp.]